MKHLVFYASAFASLATAALAAPPLDGARILRDVKVLASDEYEGRAPASPAEIKTVSYLIAQMKAAGLAPAGEPLRTGRAWTQDVPLARFAPKGPVSVMAMAGAQHLNWTQGEEIAVRASQTGQTQLSVKDVPVVFLGYGVTAPERGWDDFKGVDLKGKIGLVLVNDPDFEGGEGDFGGKAMTYYGRWTYKFEEAARQGAVGFLVIHETAPASYGWATVKNSNTGEVFDVIRDRPLEAHAPLEGWIQRDAAAALATAAGQDFEALKAAARTKAFRPVPLTGVTLSVEMAVDAQKVISRNVMGTVRGSGRPDEQVIYPAHWDHLGVGLPDAKGDRIYNGAVDNGTGVAVLLEIARAFAAGPKPQRSVSFLVVTAEEKGLLGSEYYAAKPIYPLATTVGILNMDALSPTGKARDFSTSGNAPLTLQDDLIAVGKAHGRTYSPDPRPEAGSFFRSDHFPLAKRGVPAISFDSGEDLVAGGKAAGAAFSTTYTTERYHQPSDQVTADWNAEGLVADGAMMFDLGAQLANSRVWPEWKPGAEFKAERDKTAAQRK